MKNKAKKPMELYVHIPFCVKKCDYCDFLSGPAGKERQREYFQSLGREIAAVPEFPDREITTVFIGGGTPSVPDSALMGAILDQIRNKFFMTPDAEITIEANPGTLYKEKLEDYLEHAPKELYEPQKDTESTGQNVSEDATIEDKAGEKKVVDTIVISSPITGLAADLSTTPDEAFAGRMMGDGAVVTPEDAIVRAPEDGEVCFVFDTKHAIGFMTESGVSLLIHVGIDTVKLDGKGFECFVENGQAVRKGDPMLKLDLDYLRENAPSVASPVLCTELEDNQKIRLLNEGEIKAGDELFAIDIYEA